MAVYQTAYYLVLGILGNHTNLLGNQKYNIPTLSSGMEISIACQPKINKPVWALVGIIIYLFVPVKEYKSLTRLV